MRFAGLRVACRPGLSQRYVAPCAATLTVLRLSAAQFVDIHVDADVPENVDVHPELEVRI